MRVCHDKHTNDIKYVSADAELTAHNLQANPAPVLRYGDATAA